MAQNAKPIDLTRSYLPIDPNSLTQTMHATQGEDAPEQRFPVIPYEGWNFMPSSYGYRSYFGTNAKLDIEALDDPKLTREVFVFQKADLTNMVIALRDDGIWTKQGESSGDWTQQIVLTPATAPVLQEWSMVIIQNVLIVYRQGDSVVYECKAPDYVFTEQTPTFINMAGQLGIFKAGGRLGFWDSANAIGWSALENKYDVTPDIGTGANITSFRDVIGKVIFVAQHGEGFIIYGTKSIVGVMKNLDNSFLWQAVVISNVAGISYRKQVAVGSPDTVHFVWTSIGFMRINNFKAEILAPEFYDYLKESQVPVYLKFLSGRYLFVYLADEKYVDGQITFYTQNVPAQTIVISEFEEWTTRTEDDLSDAETGRDHILFVSQHASHIWAFNQPDGCTASNIGFCVGKDYPVYRDYFRLVNLFNGPMAGYTQGDLLSLLNNFSTIQSVVKAAARNKGSLNLVGTLTNMLSDSPFPSGSVIITDNVPATTETAVSIPAYPAENDAQQTGEKVYTVESNGDFYSRFNSLVETYNRFAKAWGNLLYTRLRKYEGSQVVKQNSDLNDCAFYTAAGFGDLTPTNIKGPVQNLVTQGSAFAIDDERSRLFAEFVHELKAEYGIHDDEIPWAIARPSRYRRIEGAYNCSMRIHGVVISVAVTTGGHFTGFTFDDQTLLFDGVSTDNLDLSSSLAAILAAAQAWMVAIDPGHTAEYEGAAPVLTDRPYVDHEGNVQATTVDDAVTVKIVNNDDGSELTLSMKTTSITTIDTFTVSDTLLDHVTMFVTKFCQEPILASGMSYPASYVQYDMLGNATVSETVSPYAGITASPYGALADTTRNTATANTYCNIDADMEEDERFDGMLINVTLSKSIPVTFELEDDLIMEFTFSSPEVSIILPETSFLMQEGTAAPYDIIWEGAYVYDNHFNKWGKMKAEFRELLDFSPLNSTAVGTIPFTQFGIEGAIFNDDGEIRLFDVQPDDSYIKYGKYGASRQGFTVLEELRAQFRQGSTGTLEIETSIDGKSVEIGLTKTYSFEDAMLLGEGIGNSGRWHNIAFRGNFDLSYLEARSWVHSRR